MAGFKFLELPPELRIAVYNQFLPPRDGYYAHKSSERHASPSDYDNLRMTCHQVKNEVEHEVMSSIPISIAAVTEISDDGELYLSQKLPPPLAT